jgi:hydroxypyruvate isomerase
MPRFSANISMLFREYPLIERAMAAKRAGFAAIECQVPYEAPAEDWALALEAAGIPLVHINLNMGDVAAGDFGLAAVPGREDEFRAAVTNACVYAERLGVERIHVVAGKADSADERCRALFAENLRLAATAFAEVGAQALVEPLNRKDVPGYFIAGSDEGIAAIDLGAHDNIALQYDLYHMQMTEGDLIATMKRLLPRIGHVQFADAPGRHEPGTGEINFANVFAALDEAGYTGWVGAEYLPSGATADSLGWM